MKLKIENQKGLWSINLPEVWGEIYDDGTVNLDGSVSFEELELIYFAAKAVKDGEKIEHKNIEVIDG